MIEYFHASKFGNGARAAKEIHQQLAASVPLLKCVYRGWFAG
jgi:hypothetical protein